MGMCLRPCQQVVSREEYATRNAPGIGISVDAEASTCFVWRRTARDRLSAELDYEAAAREHKRIEKIQERT